MTSEKRYSYARPDNVIINHIDSGLPKWLIIIGFIWMILGAIAAIHPIHLLVDPYPILFSIIDTGGTFILYLAMFLGMRHLYRPMSIFWILLLSMGVLKVVLYLIGPSVNELHPYFPMALILIYIPLGTLLTIWYRGRLKTVGICMAIRVVLMIAIFCALTLLGFPNEWYIDIPMFLINLALAVSLYRVLV